MINLQSKRLRILKKQPAGIHTPIENAHDHQQISAKARKFSANENIILPHFEEFARSSASIFATEKKAIHAKSRLGSEPVSMRFPNNEPWAGNHSLTGMF
jgi:hypothetical protein